MRLFYRDLLIIICMLNPTSNSFFLEKVAKNQNSFSCSLYEIDRFETANCTGTFVHTKQTGVIANHGVCTIKKYDLTEFSKEEKICLRGAWSSLSRQGYSNGRRVKRFFGFFLSFLVVVGILCLFLCGTSDTNRSPTYSGSNRSPTNSGSNRSPTNSGSNRSPTNSGSNRSPTNSGSNRSPTYSGSNRRPAYSSSNRRPSITCPSIPSRYTTKPLETTVFVYWKQPTYSDPDGDSVRVTQHGKRSGSAFSKGHYTISYVAKDVKGASASCQFKFTVEVLSCKQPSWPYHGRRTCSHVDYIVGSTCTYTCNDGFVLSHNNILKCLQSRIYDHTPPTCIRIKCQVLPTPKHGQLKCTNKNFYKSVCKVSCNTKDGYKPKNQAETRCQVNKRWTAKLATCEDVEGPSFTYCPPDITTDADRGQRSTTVTWKQPQAVDNHDSPDNIAIDLVEGQSDGSRFEIGIHGQKYIAKDQKRNKSPLCQFNVIVQERVCDSPEGIFNDTFIYTRCPSGFTFGSSCDVYCSDNYQLIGNVTTISCERNETTDEMGWKWGDEPKPSCNSDICADLTPPLNGALSCKKAGVNEFCTMSCNIKYDIPRTVDVRDFFICSNDGVWTPSSVPDCTERKHPTRMVLPGAFYYFTGSCAVQNQIKSNFISIMNAQVGLDVCPPNDCSVEDVEVTCGTKRRKRDVIELHRLRRSTRFLIELNFKIRLNWKQINGSGSEELEQNEIFVSDIWYKLVSTATSIAENIKGTTFYSSRYDWSDDVCIQQGTKAVYSSLGVSCAGCPTGTMYDGTIDDCKVCPKGTYQDEAFQSSCKDCQEGTSTVNTGSRNETFCIKKCKPGYFSSNGLETCAPCQRGTYQSSRMSTSCQKCDALKTTISKGSIAKTDCSDFDIVFNSPEKVVEMEALGKAIKDFTLGYWISCPATSDSFPAFKLKKNGNTTLNIKAGLSPLITLFSQQIEVPGGRNVWNHLALSWTSSRKTVRVYVDGIYNNHVLDVTETIVVEAGAKLEIEQTSGDTADCQLSGFFFINKSLEDTELQSIMGTCHPAVVGAVYTMDDFISLGIAAGFQTIAPSKCDGFDDCKSSPCGAHRCQNRLNGYKCKCIKGYKGDRCEVAPDYCLNNECQNGATCKTQTWNYTCDCSDGYRGTVCEEKIVDGNWTPWSSWGECSVTCGTGFQTRQRNCTNPPPDPEGKDCIGNNEEQQSCATEKCPQCPSSSTIRNKNVLKCRSTGDFESCEVSCRPGHVPLHPLRNPYYCGPNSSHVWAPERRAPACTIPKSPEKMQIKSAVGIRKLPCSTDSITIINNNLKILPCVNDSSCQTEVSLSGCDSSSRKRRSTSTTGVKVNFYINLQGGDNFNLTSFLETGLMSDGLKKYVDALISLEKTGQELNSTYESVFNVTIKGVTYELDASSFRISGKLDCPNGTVPNDGGCVECGPGTKEVDNACTWCSIGTYQDGFGQTECIACPVGNTTEFMGSINVTECSEIAETENDTFSSAATMESKPSSSTKTTTLESTPNTSTTVSTTESTLIALTSASTKKSTPTTTTAPTMTSTTIISTRTTSTPTTTAASSTKSTPTTATVGTTESTPFTSTKTTTLESTPNTPTTVSTTESTLIALTSASTKKSTPTTTTAPTMTSTTIISTRTTSTPTTTAASSTKSTPTTATVGTTESTPFTSTKPTTLESTPNNSTTVSTTESTLIALTSASTKKSTPTTTTAPTMTSTTIISTRTTSTPTTTAASSTKSTPTTATVGTTESTPFTSTKPTTLESTPNNSTTVSTTESTPIALTSASTKKSTPTTATVRTTESATSTSTKTAAIESTSNTSTTDSSTKSMPTTSTTPNPLSDYIITGVVIGTIFLVVVGTVVAVAVTVAVYYNRNRERMRNGPRQRSVISRDIVATIDEAQQFKPTSDISKQSTITTPF